MVIQYIFYQGEGIEVVDGLDVKSERKGIIKDLGFEELSFLFGRF